MSKQGSQEIVSTTEPPRRLQVDGHTTSGPSGSRNRQTLYKGKVLPRRVTGVWVLLRSQTSRRRVSPRAWDLHDRVKGRIPDDPFLLLLDLFFNPRGRSTIQVPVAFYVLRSETTINLPSLFLCLQIKKHDRKKKRNSWRFSEGGVVLVEKAIQLRT